MRLYASGAVICLLAAPAALIINSGVGSSNGSSTPSERGTRAATPAGPAQRRAADVVSGVVSEASGRPMRGATVELLRAGTVVATTTTDEHGRFVFEHVAAGMYDVRASRTGLVPAGVRLVVNALQGAPILLSLGVEAMEHSELLLRQSARVAGNPAIVGAGAVGGVVGGVAESMPSAMPVSPSPSMDAFVMLGPHQPGPQAPFNTATYDRINDNRFRRVGDEPLSTFSIDVDTASYSNVRRFLNQGTLPPADAVRTEELLNYFAYGYPAPTANVPFAVTTQVAACPWSPRHRLALVGLQARRVSQDATPARNLVFLLDVSGSMTPTNRLPLVQTAMRMLVDTLSAQDRVAIVVYAGASGLVLPSTPGNRREEIHRAIRELQAGGSTNGAAGIQLAYNTAAAAFITRGVNRVILATDGDFNVGVTSQGELVRLIEQERARGIFLSVLGVGDDNLKDSTMESLADKGNGNYAYLDSLHEARRVLVETAGATLVTVAKDVKIQVEFNPRTVAAYRLVGYENRLLQREDFNDDSKDAGEMGAGHSVTALYELIPPGEPLDGPTVDALKYQQPPHVVDAARSGDLMTVKLRYKAADGDTSRLLSVVVPDHVGELTPSIGFAAAVAQFGMLLRHSEFKGQSSWSSAQALARQYRGDDPDGYRAEFIRLLDLAAALESQDGGPRETRR